mmetsp:Transcript_111667/g.266381  ORF Transcript_111667/g.266381 Transcript_111667/m.266381 type:complete len:226 (-) Transcript_111667:1360-2037(-)
MDTASAPLASRSSVGPLATRKGFSRGFRKAVPWLPLIVTQPSAASFSARQRTRRTFDSSSSSGPARTSTSSDVCILRTVDEEEIVKPSVIATSRMQVAYSWTALKKAGRVMPTFPPNSRYKSATCSWVRSAVKLEAYAWNSGRESCSASPFTALSKAASRGVPCFRNAVLKPFLAWKRVVLTTCACATRKASVALWQFLSAADVRDLSFVSSTRACSRRFRLGPR